MLSSAPDRKDVPPPNKDFTHLFDRRYVIVEHKDLPTMQLYLNTDNCRQYRKKHVYKYKAEDKIRKQFERDSN